MRDPNDDLLQLTCLVEVFVALLATIVLRYEVAFPEAAVGAFLACALLTPPVLALSFEVHAVLNDLGQASRLHRVATAPKRQLKRLSSRLRDRSRAALPAAPVQATCPREPSVLVADDAPRRKDPDRRGSSAGKLERSVSFANVLGDAADEQLTSERRTLAEKRLMAQESGQQYGSYKSRHSDGAATERPSSLVRQSSANDMRRASMAEAAHMREARLTRGDGPGKQGTRWGALQSRIAPPDLESVQGIARAAAEQETARRASQNGAGPSISDLLQGTALGEQLHVRQTRLTREDTLQCALPDSIGTRTNKNAPSDAAADAKPAERPPLRRACTGLGAASWQQSPALVSATVDLADAGKPDDVVREKPLPSSHRRRASVEPIRGGRLGGAGRRLSQAVPLPAPTDGPPAARTGPISAESSHDAGTQGGANRGVLSV